MFAPATAQEPVQEEKLPKVIPEYTEPSMYEPFIPEYDAPPVVVKPIAAGRAHSLFFTPEDDSRSFPMFAARYRALSPPTTLGL